MPLSPRQCKKSRSGFDRVLLRTSCEEIDRVLSYSDRDEYWINSEDVGGPNGSLIQEIIQAYEAVGWDVRIVHDNRDGNALVFKERK